MSAALILLNFIWQLNKPECAWNKYLNSERIDIIIFAFRIDSFISRVGGKVSIDLCRVTLDEPNLLTSKYSAFV